MRSIACTRRWRPGWWWGSLPCCSCGAAPVALARQGWLTGLASWALGALAFGMTCPLDGMVHLGLWHVLPVPVAAVIARVVVPPLVQW
jgi:hypothetical protein